MLKYFGVNKDEVVILEVNNQEERKYLQGVATEANLERKLILVLMLNQQNQVVV